MADKPRSPRDLLSLGLLILVALSLVFAASQLLRGAAHVLPVPPLDLTPEPGEETVDPQQPDISTDDLRELSLAVAAVITALTGLLGLVATQIWRGREEGRAEQKHIVALERELSESLGSRVDVVPGRGKKGKLVIHYADFDVLDGVLERLRNKP